MQCLRAVGGASRRAQSLHDSLQPSMCGRSHTTWSPSPCGGLLQGREMETTAMRAAAVRADSAGSSPDAPTQPIGLTDPLSLSPAAKASVQILIVDDERTLRESCASMLKHEGYNVRVCSRGEEALETLKRVRFDIVLLDLYMAQVQGMELLRVTLETHPETIVIVMTGHPSVTSNLEALLESEMFGHVKGAFTGAVRDKPGLLEMANGGTLFLDELIEMSKPIQAKLLRAIQDGVVRRVGSERTDAVVNVRFIACTNCNPEEALRSGQLREDLYYRLRVVPIQVPPLRDRPEDIPLLATHFLAYYWRRHRESDAPLPKLSETAVRELRSRPWKGNVRELQNVIEHLVVLLRPGADVQPEDIPVIDGPMPTEDPDESASAIKDADNAIADGYRATRERLLGRFESRFLQQLVTQADGNVSRAARIARLNRTTLYRLMERYGLQRKLLASDLEEPEE